MLDLDVRQLWSLSGNATFPAPVSADDQNLLWSVEAITEFQTKWNLTRRNGWRRLDRLVAKRELRPDGLNDSSAYRVASPSASSGEWTSMAPPPERLVTFSRLHGERVWRRIGERDGWAIWASECVVCGGPVQITTLLGLRAIGSSRAFWTVTCPKHRLTKTESGKLRQPATRREVFEAIKGAKLAQ